jgi:transposase-like protein
LPPITCLNKTLNIVWSGCYLLDGLFFSVAGRIMVLLILSDARSLDVIGYDITEQENYYSWLKFLTKIKPVISRSDIQIFFVSDGKRGLHQALSELFPNIPVQLCLAHKLRRIYQIIPHIRGDGYDRLFAHLAQLAITAPLKEIYQSCLNILLGFLLSKDFDFWDKSRQEKLRKVIGALRFQKNKLHTRYRYAELIGKDTTTNILEGINSFLKERLNLMKGLRKEAHVELIIKLLVYYYRFHQFTSSRFKERNGKCPIELNQNIDKQNLDEIIKGKEPYSWIRKLILPT